jgi:hypothetical protein
MHSEVPDPVPDTVVLACRGLLPTRLRRDLTDLNAQFLELGATAAPPGDLRFGWSDPVHRRLAGLDGPVRQRIAEAPFALFRLLVPPIVPCSVTGIADEARRGPEAGWTERCTSFAHQAAFFARRLCDGASLAASVVLNLASDAQSVLVGLRPSELADLAAHPGFLRPRWSRHERYWQMLEASAQRESAVATQWAHCVGVCLLGVDDQDTAAAGPAIARRKPRR